MLARDERTFALNSQTRKLAAWLAYVHIPKTVVSERNGERVLIWWSPRPTKPATERGYKRGS